jgi:hypothetical protein
MNALTFSIGLLAGSTWMDPSLADYRWDLSARPGVGVQALASAGRFATGLRMWRTGTTQATGLDAPASVDLHATSGELIGRGRMATLFGADVNVVASVGRLHLGYEPDEIAVPAQGTVELRPIDEWIYGTGLAFERPLFGRWGADLEVNRRFFGLDTAHRNGNEIEYRRQTFGDWSARLGLAWAHREH